MPDCRASDCTRSYNPLTTVRRRNTTRDGYLGLRRSRANEGSGYAYCIQNGCEARICRGKPGRSASYVQYNCRIR
ncbi:hypothetical protein PISMIDRAFT_673104 [Pisolithus microcarpus 441]|uniref:Uncharacterized protein n=1 Tax=Pisolithus microcarpus 441 TaxID=765257 RepID=A0A0C9ZS07_9AGAM|nr:hypothetical protein PISMIDRAFT_673104 [Pisolithus microcarpus 441]